ncbi:hypothetical protein BGZ65_007259, partial [Modicella reniformis]
MSTPEATRHDESDHEEFLDPDEGEEVQVLENSGDIMDEDDDENVEGADQYDENGNPVNDDDQMVELQDDSVQGFFTHK